MSQSPPAVGIVMGSDSDWPFMEEAAEALTSSVSYGLTWSRRTGCG